MQFGNDEGVEDDLQPSAYRDVEAVGNQKGFFFPECEPFEPKESVVSLNQILQSISQKNHGSNRTQMSTLGP